ncbi:MAG: hypothetical protein GY795_45855 [Desulfobacterales bacterium]|nr:hypothetical protein [Desulfobacterales bacterium]
MVTDPLNTPSRLIADNEVIDLCNSISDIHRALKSLSQFFGDLEDPACSDSELSGNAFILWGLKTIAERFMADQKAKLNRILEIYESATARLVEKAAID